MNIVLIEDDYIQMNEYKKIIESCLENEDKTIHCFNEPIQFQKYLQKVQRIDLVIMDIRLPQANGIEIAKEIKSKFSYAKIIFISAYLEYSPYVYEVEHVYFIYKKNTLNRLPGAIIKAVNQLKKEQTQILEIHWKNETIYLDMYKIQYIEHEGRKSRIFTEDKEYVVYEKIKDLLVKLPEDRFIQVHHSFILNYNFIHSFTRGKIILKNNKEVLVSRSYEKETRNKLYNYLCDEII